MNCEHWKVPPNKSLILQSLDLIYFKFQAVELKMCTLWMSIATNLSHIDSLEMISCAYHYIRSSQKKFQWILTTLFFSKDSFFITRVEASLLLPCVPIYELYCSKSFVKDSKASELWALEASPQTKSLTLQSLDLILCWIQAEGLEMCTLWMSIATNLSHIDSLEMSSYSDNYIRISQGNLQWIWRQ
jgi:hypothetical protein